MSGLKPRGATVVLDPIKLLMCCEFFERLQRVCVLGVRTKVQGEDISMQEKQAMPY